MYQLNLSIPKAGEMKEKEGLKNLFKDGRWGGGGGKCNGRSPKF